MMRTAATILAAAGLALGAGGFLPQPLAADPPAGSANPAEPDMPRGPAEIFNRNQQKQQRRPTPLSSGTKTPAAEGNPAQTGSTGPAGAATQPDPHGGMGLPPTTDPHAGMGEAPAGDPHAGGGDPAAGGEGEQAAGGALRGSVIDAPSIDRRPIAVAEPSDQVPSGTIRVRVIDPATGDPAVGAKLQLGTMNRDNSRTTQDAVTDENGQYSFEKMATGNGQAYRVNLLHQGAKYSSTPFRLTPERGYEVLIRRMPTTNDLRQLVLYVGATSLEVRDERLKIVQQARLVNIMPMTVVFPPEGQLVKLPPNAKAFQAEEIMTDQHLQEVAGKGFKITGSVTPGEATITWGFDIPYDETSLDLAFEMPWTTFAYRVVSDLVPGMTVEIEGMPAPEIHEEHSRKFLASEIVKQVGEEPFRELKIHVRGLPGPGPMRYFALAFAILVAIGGVIIARRQPVVATTNVSADTFAERKAALQARAAKLAEDRERGEIGPAYHAEQMTELEEQMAAALYERNAKPAAS